MPKLERRADTIVDMVTSVLSLPRQTNIIMKVDFAASFLASKERFLPRCLKYLRRRKNLYMLRCTQSSTSSPHRIGSKWCPIFATQVWKPSLCPSPRDHPAGFGLGNYFAVETMRLRPVLKLLSSE
jgi:hypothetical protein